jgi:hypothetical protein
MKGDYYILHENKTFSDVPVSLDNSKYVNCRFERVTFLYSGGPWIVEKCTVDAGCALMLQGEAGRVGQLLQALKEIGLTQIQLNAPVN